MNTIVLANAVSAANVVDVAVLILLFIFCIGGTMRGLAGELARLLGLSTSVAAGILFYPVAREHLVPGDEMSWVVLAAAGAVVAAAIIGTAVYWVVRKFLKVIIGQPADSIIGGVFATMTTAIVLLIALFFAYSVPHEKLRATLYEESISGRLSEPIIEYLRGKMDVQQQEEVRE